jgi:thioredoxin reductase (NADPH)
MQNETTSPEQNLSDVTIVGAGPAGLFATFYAGMRQMSIHLIDSLPQVGGQLAALYPEKFIYDMPGFPKVLAKDLVNNMWEQAQLGKPKLSLNTKVKLIEKIESSTGPMHFKISCEGGEVFYTKSVILALGIGAFAPKKLDIPGLSEREGNTVHYKLKPLDYYNNREVLVIGGGDSALDWSLAMSDSDSGKPRCTRTVLIHRGNKFTAHEASVEQLKRTATEIRLNHELVEISDVIHNMENRTQVVLENNLTKERHTMLVDDVIICTGFVAKIDFIKESGLNLQGNSIVVNERMETNIHGIFAVGDVTTHGAKLKLIATGVGEAAIAANWAKVIVDPSSKAFPGHSTSKFGH